MPIKDDTGAVTGFIAIESDITNLKNAIQEMQRSEQTLHAFMDHAPLVAFVKDVSGKYTFFNKTYRDFMGKDLKSGDTD
jgi:PAS domain-containing protein